jgi:hypothetical protein
MSRRPDPDWMKFSSALNQYRRHFLFFAPYTVRFTSTRRWLMGAGAHTTTSSSWTTSRALLLSGFASTMTYLYYRSRPQVDNLYVGDRHFKYATLSDFANVNMLRFQSLRSFRPLNASYCRHLRNYARYYPMMLLVLTLTIYEPTDSPNGRPPISRSSPGLLPTPSLQKKSPKLPRYATNIVCR